MKKGRYVFSLILNLLIIAAAGFTIANLFLKFLPCTGTTAEIISKLEPIDYLFEIGVLSCLFATLVSLFTIISHIVSLASKKPTAKGIAVLKTISAGLVLFAVVNYFVLDGVIYGINAIGFSGDYQANFISFLLDWHGPLFFSVVIPALVVIDYLFCELEPKVSLGYSFLSLIPALLYFGFVVVFDYLFVSKKAGNFPELFVFNPFYFAENGNLVKTIIVVAGGVLAILLLTMLLLGIRNGVRKAVVKEGVAVDEVNEVNEEETAASDTDSDNSDNTDSVETTEDNTEVEAVAAPTEEAATSNDNVEFSETAKPVEEAETTIAPADDTVESTETTIPTTETTAPTTETTVAPTVEPAKATTTVKEEPTVTETKKPVKKVIILKTKPSSSSNSVKPVATDKKATYKSNPRVYHISKQSNGRWQVKLATGERAIKLFATQQKAIDYAKSLVRTQGGSIRVHAVSGKLRKE